MVRRSTFELGADSEAYDAWFRAKVCEALDDPRRDLSSEDVEAEFATRRAATLRSWAMREAGLGAARA